MPTPIKHALLSASSAHRWLECTAAPRFEEQFPSGTSEYAEEGTLAHSICELYARQYFATVTKRKFNAELKKLQAKEYYSDEMLRTAEAYVQYLKEKALGFKEAPYVTQEIKVDFSDYVPEGFGTCDCVMIGGDTLHITDYKHGKGVPVSAVGNPQMRLYALGALKLFKPIYGDSIQKVSMGICQPRLSETASKEELTVEQLYSWGESIKPLANEAFNGSGVFVPGEHCRFCKGKAQCRARAEQNTALEDFKDCVPAGKVAPELLTLTPEAQKVIGLPPMLSDAEIGALLERGKTLVQWYTDIQAYALEALLAGKDIPGYKVVEGRSIRAFKDAEEAINTLINNGVEEALIYDRKPKSLSELEKMLGKKQFAEMLADQIVKPQGKPTLVPADDKRPAYNSAVADFTGVESE